MNIDNRYVLINCGNGKVVTLKNLILNNYLSIFSKCQYDKDICKQYGNGEKTLSRCYLKFDNPIEKDITPNMNLSGNDFNLYFASPIVKQTGTINSIEITYTFRSDSGYFNPEDKEITENVMYDIDKFYNRKITAIAFGNQKGEIFTIIDTFNYNMYITDSSEFRIIRCDIFNTDALCYNSDFPTHLAPIGKNSSLLLSLYEPPAKYEYGILYSIGLSSTLGILESEFIIGKDIEVEVIDDYSFKFVLSKKMDKTIYPSSLIMPGSNKYPTAYVPIVELYPRLNLHPNSSKYPLRAEYKFIIIKYKEYFINEENEMEFTGNEYMMYYYNETNGIFNFITKIERGDE